MNICERNHNLHVSPVGGKLLHRFQNRDTSIPIRAISFNSRKVNCVRPPTVGSGWFTPFRRVDGEFITSISTMIIVPSSGAWSYFVNGARLERSLECRRRGGDNRLELKDTLFAVRVPNGLSHFDI